MPTTKKVLALAALLYTTATFPDATTDLFAAIEHCSLPDVTLALEAGADINAVRKDGHSPLALAAHKVANCAIEDGAFAYYVSCIADLADAYKTYAKESEKHVLWPQYHNAPSKAYLTWASLELLASSFDHDVRYHCDVCAKNNPLTSCDETRRATANVLYLGTIFACLKDLYSNGFKTMTLEYTVSVGSMLYFIWQKIQWSRISNELQKYASLQALASPVKPEGLEQLLAPATTTDAQPTEQNPGETLTQ